MKMFYIGKDGGVSSRVTGFWLVEIKNLFSIALLHFDAGSREAFHTHAFNSVSWLLRGGLVEKFTDGRTRFHRASFKPIITRRYDFHQVHGLTGLNLVLTFRGPWVDKWQEYLPCENRSVTLTHGRVEV